MNTVFELSPPGAKPMLIFLVLAILVPVSLVGIALKWSNKTIPITTVAVIVLAILLPACVIGWSIFSRRSLEISADEIIVKAAFYTTSLKRAELGSAVLLGALNELPGGNISLRTNGIGLPGYQAGWFTRKNGRLLFASIGDGALLYIPSGKHFDIALSLSDPNAALESLKKNP